MQPGKYNFTLPQGTTFRRPIIIPLNLTGYTARMQVRPAVGKPSVLDLTTANGGITITPGAESTVTIVILPAQSSPIKLKRGVYDLELVSPTGEVLRPIEGRITFSPEVTTL